MRILAAIKKTKIHTTKQQELSYGANPEQYWHETHILLPIEQCTKYLANSEKHEHGRNKQS